MDLLSSHKKNKKFQNITIQLQRELAIRTNRGYKTISAESTTTLSPIHILSAFQAQKTEIKFNKKERTANAINLWMKHPDQKKKTRNLRLAFTRTSRN